ncbi:MAG: hypothetical protein OSA89_20520, partial [Mariniblastus sp.]|nr:hypothetical protein [Mariniblastus sp.]
TGGNTTDRNSGRSPRNSKFSGMQNSLNAGGDKKSTSKDSRESEKTESSSKKSSGGPAGPAKL